MNAPLGRAVIGGLLVATFYTLFFVPVMYSLQNRVHYRKVERGRDYGAEVEVVSGLAGGETVVVYPGDALPDGQEVEPVAAPK